MIEIKKGYRNYIEVTPQTWGGCHLSWAINKVSEFTDNSIVFVAQVVTKDIALAKSVAMEIATPYEVPLIINTKKIASEQKKVMKALKAQGYLT